MRQLRMIGNGSMRLRSRHLPAGQASWFTAITVGVSLH